MLEGNFFDEAPRMRRIWATLLMGLFLALAPAAFASTTWYVNGTTGSDNNDCKSPTTACKTIGHAISLTASGDTIKVASATYTENLSIGINLSILGSGAKTTFVNGGGHLRVVTISSTSANVTLSGVTITNGDGSGQGGGGGIHNVGTLTMNRSTVSGNVSGIGGGIYSTGTLTIN